VFANRAENSLPLSVQMCCFRVFSVLLHHINIKSDSVSKQVVVEDVSLLFGIDLNGDKVIMDQIISEEPSYEERELKKYRDFSCMCYYFSRKKTSGRDETLLQDGTIETSDVELKDIFVWLMSRVTCCISMAICLVIS
jgi:hypothetical protein